jgi:hypothetical protein
MVASQGRTAQEIMQAQQAAPAETAVPARTAEEILAMDAANPKPEGRDAVEVMARGATAMYDWRNPRPSREEYFGNKALLADLKKQGVEADGPGVGAMIGDLFVSGADAISSAVWKYDPANEGSITLRNAADFVTRGMYSNLQGKPSTFNPGAAMIETGRRAGATLAGANEFNLDFYKSLSRGLASSPKYRVEETGEFVYPGTMMPDAGMGDTTFDLVQMYKQQGKTLRPVGEEDLKDLEYEQFLQKLDSTQQLETLMEQGTASGTGTIARSVGVPDQVVSAGGDFIGRLNETIDIAARASGLAPAGYRTADLPWNEPQKPIQSQSMIGSMLVDPGAVGAGVLSPVRFGITAAAKGATARTLELTGKAATAVANLGDKGAKGARVAQRAKRLLGAGGVGAVANVMGQNMDSEAADEAVRFLNYGLGAYATLVGGGVVLRGYGNYAGKASYLLRESIGPGNAIDKGARAAVAVNPDVPLRYKDPLVRPSVYTAMESTPARLSKDMSLSPRARKLFGNLADWRAVQAVRGTSAAASGAVKGALANVPFSEPLRAAGEEDAANLMLGLGAVIGAPMGVAGRVSGTAGRRAMAADSDVGRMLAEVQGMGETVPRKRAPQADPDGEVMRTLTEVELSGGDVSAMVNNLSPDRLNEFAAVQGYFRDTTDFVPLNAADFEANRKALNPNNSGPIFLHAPDGERPRVFVNVEDAGSIKAGDLGRAFLQSESLPDRQVAAMINSVETLYTPEQIAARERAIAKAEIDAKYAKQGVKGGATDAEIDLRLAMLRSQSQTEFGDANIWSRQAIAAEDLSSGIVDWNRMRRGLPKGNNPITHLENVLGAQARGLMISGVRIDPETGRPLDTPDSIKRTNPAAADDPAVAQGLKNYTEGYNKMRRDPANETPTTEPVSPERAAAIELSMTDAPMRSRQIMDLAGGPDGPTLTPDNLSFGWRQEGNRRILAGRSLPDRVRYANHWKPHLEMIDTVQAAINDGTPVAVRFDALGPSADVTKRPGPQYGATTREGVLVRWQATTGRKRENYKGGGELNVLLADMTTLRNRAITVMEAKHPTLDTSRGGPGYSLAAIMADAETYIANRGRNADPGTGLTPERLRVAKGLIEYGPDNVFGGLIDKDGIWRTPRLELIESVTPTGRRGHNMVGNNADGTMTQPPPKPMPDMGSDVAPAAPDAPAAAARDRIKRNLGSQSGALDVSILADIVDYGRSLYRAGMDAAVWTANMIKEFGERIKPLLQEAFKRVVNAYQASRFSDTTGAVNVTPMNKPKATPDLDAIGLKSARFLESAVGDGMENLRKRQARRPGTGVAKNNLVRFHTGEGKPIYIGAVKKDGGKSFKGWIEETESWLTPAQTQQFRQWYKELYGHFTNIFGNRAGEMMMAWLAAQQNVSPGGALKNVFRVEDRIAGIGTGKKGGLADAKIEGVLRDVVPEGGFGPKLSDFVDSGFQRDARTYMAGRPEGGRPFVADVHTGRDSGHVDQQTLSRLKDLSDEGNLFIDGAPATVKVTKTKTVKRGDKTAVVPERIRVTPANGKSFFVDVDMRGSPGSTQYEGISVWGNSMTDFLNETQWQGGNWTPAEVQAVGWMRTLRQYGLPESTVDSALQQNSSRIFAEVNYSSGDLLPANFPGFDTLRPEAQAAITTDVITQSVNELSQIIGGSLRVQRVSAGTGVWGKSRAPTTVIEVLGSPEAADMLGLGLATVSEQAATMSATLGVGGKNSKAMTFRKADGSKFSDVEMQSLIDDAGLSGYTVQQLPGGDIGFVVDSAADFRPKGFTEKRAAQFEKNIVDWAGRNGVDLQVDTTPAQIKSYGNNWQNQKGGESYISGLIERGGSSRVRDVLRFRRRFAEILQDAIQRHAPEAVAANPAQQIAPFRQVAEQPPPGVLQMMQGG